MTGEALETDQRGDSSPPPHSDITVGDGPKNTPRIASPDGGNQQVEPKMEPSSAIDAPSVEDAAEASQKISLNTLISPNPTAEPTPAGAPANPETAMEHIPGALPSVMDDWSNYYDETGSAIESAIIDSTSFTDSDMPRIQAFAKLEFDDGQFYMNTYSIILGRDVRAALRAEAQEAKDFKEKLQRSHSSEKEAQRAKGIKREGSWHTGVSESGGIVNLENEAKPEVVRPRSQRSSVGIGNILPPHMIAPDKFPDVQNPFYREEVASIENTSAFLPDPHHCPLIPIHPPVVEEGEAAGHKGISREHVKLNYNFQTDRFEAVVLGRNGIFVDEEFYGRGQKVELESGSFIQVGGVRMRFLLPEAPGDDGTAHSSAMSFNFEDGRGESQIGDDYSETSTSQELEELQYKLTKDQGADDAEEEEDEDEEDDDGAEDEEEDESQNHRYSRTRRRALPTTKQKVKLKLSKPKTQKPLGGKSKGDSAVDVLNVPPKKKGPGRPPKNGIMSKRDEALLRRQAREAAKTEALKANGGKGGKTHKEATPEDPSAQPAKRKYTKRKKVEEAEGAQVEIQESVERDGADQATPAEEPQETKQVKEKKPIRPPRTPSPEIKESDYTEEQLQKPNLSYVVMIFDALTEAKGVPLSLSYIYKAIERKYPYFKFRTTTPGWQSSVRHNLLQHNAFQKIAREGKGWCWGLTEGVSIDKERKRKASPQRDQHQNMPRPPHPPYNWQGQYPPPGMKGQVPPNGRPPFPYPPSAFPGYPFPPPILGPNGIPLPLPFAQSRPYQSPYASNNNKEENKSHTSQPQPTIAHPANPTNPQSSQPSESVPPQSNSATPQTPYVWHPPQRAPSTTRPPPRASALSPAQKVLPQLQQPSRYSQAVLDSVESFKKTLIQSIASKRPDAHEFVTRVVDRALYEGSSTNPVTAVKSSDESADKDEKAPIQNQNQDIENVIVLHLRNLLKEKQTSNAEVKSVAQNAAQATTKAEAADAQMNGSPQAQPDGFKPSPSPMPLHPQAQEQLVKTVIEKLDEGGDAAQQGPPAPEQEEPNGFAPDSSDDESKVASDVEGNSDGDPVTAERGRKRAHEDEDTENRLRDYDVPVAKRIAV